MVNSESYHIIGSGISGLVLAYELAKKCKNVRVYESLKYCGGLTRTENINGIPYDCGPHLYHTNNIEIREYWKHLIKDSFKNPKLYGANYIDGKVYEYPISIESLNSQFNKEQIKTIKAELKSLDNSILQNSKNYEEYVKNLAGNFLSSKFFKKYPEKLWGISTEKLSAKFAPRRIEIRSSKRPFHSGKGKWAGVIAGGCGHMANELEKQINNLGVYIEYGMNLSKLTKINNDKKNKYTSIKKLTFNNSKEVNINKNDKIISTIPITELAKILKIKNRLWNRSLKIACILLDKKITLPENYDWLYFDDQSIFHRITLQNSFSEVGIPKNSSIISCEIAYNSGDKIDKMNKEKIINETVKALIKKNLINKENISHTHLIDAKSVYPGIFVGYETELSKLQGKLSFINNLYSHGALAEYEYADTQVLTAKSIDLADTLTVKNNIGEKNLKKEIDFRPAANFKIDSVDVGIDQKCFIIAEIGLNHNGDVDLCKKLIDQAKRAGASAVKLQTYKKGRISKNVRTARYYEDLVDTQESLSSLVDRIALDANQTKEIFDYAKKKKITIFSTPFDIESLEILENIGCSAYKISSMDLVNLPLIKEVSKLQKPMILSTGMSELSDIAQAIEVIKSENNNNFALLHCVSSYPCSPANANLAMIKKISQTFNTIVGYSDHTTGTDIALAAIARGANILEKHFTLDRKMDGPDHNFSIVEDELASLVSSARRVEDSNYDHGYGIMTTEIDTAQNLRRSIFYRKNLKVGKKIEYQDVEIKSPGIGLHPKNMHLVLGSKLKKSVKKDFPVEWEDIKN